MTLISLKKVFPFSWCQPVFYPVAMQCNRKRQMVFSNDDKKKKLEANKSAMCKCMYHFFVQSNRFGFLFCPFFVTICNILMHCECHCRLHVVASHSFAMWLNLHETHRSYQFIWFVINVERVCECVQTNELKLEFENHGESVGVNGNIEIETKYRHFDGKAWIYCV